ncbi:MULTISPECIES: hypothetical protein [Vibrio]|uniref:hypothetical protein n=1 Tax=Vibrio TaxID=662 RepID=UPI0035518323
MKKLLLITSMLVALIPNAFAYQNPINSCTHLNDGEIFDVTELSNICFTTELISINIINSEKNTDVYISDNLEMVALRGGQYMRVGHAFYLSSDAPYGITRRGGNIVIFGQEDFAEALEGGVHSAPKSLTRMKRSAKKGGGNNGNTGSGSTGAVGAAVGSAATSNGTEREMINSGIGAGVGVIAAGLGSRVFGKNGGEVIGAVTSATVTNALNNAEAGGAKSIGTLSHNSMGGSGGCVGCH